MYNGGISFKGDRSLAISFVEEAVKLAELVSNMKSSAGLDRLEKTFSLGDSGTVRVSNLEYSQHIYIDVSSTITSEEDAVDEEGDVSTSSFIIHAPFTADRAFSSALTSTYLFRSENQDGWDSPPALSPDRVGIRIEDSASSLTIRLLNEEATNERYNYVSTESSDSGNPALYWAEFDWTSQNGERLYCPSLTVASKYSMNWGHYPNTIRHRGGVVVNPRSGRTILGMGIFQNWLLYFESSVSDESDPGYPCPSIAFKNISLRARRVFIDESTGRYTADLSTLVVLDDSIVQLRTEYSAVPQYGRFGTVGDWGGSLYPNPVGGGEWPYADYEENQNPDADYHTQVGSLWFNFSPDGSKAVRCRAFPSRIDGAELPPGPPPDGGSRTCTIRTDSFLEEFEFALDETGEPQVTSRTITSGGSITLTATRVSSGSTTEIDEVTGSVQEPCSAIELPTSETVSTELIAGTSISQTVTGQAALAYDYDSANELTTLKVDSAGMSYSRTTQDYSLDSVDTTTSYTWSPNTGCKSSETGTRNHKSQRTYSEEITASGQMSLIYETTEGSSTIPYYYDNSTSSDSYSWSSEWETYVRIGGGQEQVPLQIIKNEQEVGGLSEVYRNNAFACEALGGLSIMDLRAGRFVTSFLASESIVARERSFTVDANGIPVSSNLAPATTTTSTSREDTLHVLSSGVLKQIPLPQVSGFQNAPAYTGGGDINTSTPSGSGLSNLYGDDYGGLTELENSALKAFFGAFHWGRYTDWKKIGFAGVGGGINDATRSAGWQWSLARGHGGSMAVNPLNGDILFSVLHVSADSTDNYPPSHWPQDYHANDIAPSNQPSVLYNLSFDQTAVYYYNAASGDIVDMSLVLTSAEMPTVDMSVRRVWPYAPPVNQVTPNHTASDLSYGLSEFFWNEAWGLVGIIHHAAVTEEL